MKKKDALYIRVSTEQQLRGGESIETQKSRLLQYAKSLNSCVYDDGGYSASDRNRPAFNRLLADIKQGKIASVTVTKLDRISRNLKEVVDLISLFEEYDVSFRALDQNFDTSTSMGRMMLNLLATVAQWEREMDSERVSIDMLHRAKSGKWNGGPVPFGYTNYSFEARLLREKGIPIEKALQKARAICPEEKRLYAHPEYSLLVKKIFDKYTEWKSQRRVTHWLNEQGYKTPRGATWASSSVSRILRNPVYVGKTVYGRRVSAKTTKRIKKRPEDEWVQVNGVHPPIIDEATFEKVQKILESQATEPRRVASEYILSGLIRCGKCGGKLHGYTQKKRDGRGYWSYYRCTNRAHKGESVCKGNSVDRDKIEKAVIDSLLHFHKDKSLVEAKEALELFNKKVLHQEVPLKKEKAKLVRENEKIQRQKQVLIRELASETITSNDYKEAVKELDEAFDRNNARLREIDDQLNDLGIEEISFESVYSILNDLPRRWKYADFQGRKTILWSIVRSMKYTDSDKPVEIDVFFLGKRQPTETCLQSGRGSSHKPIGIEPGRSIGPSHA